MKSKKKRKEDRAPVLSPDVLAGLVNGVAPKNEEEKLVLKQIKEIEKSGRSVYIPGEI